MITLLNCLVILASCILLPFSPFFYLVLKDQLFSNCNSIASANVVAVNTIDMFRCQLDMVIPEYDRNVTMPIPCYEIVSKNITNIKVVLNHYYQDACFKIVMSNEDRNIQHYSEILFYYNMYKIEAIFFIVSMCLIGIIGAFDQTFTTIKHKVA